MSSDHFQHHMHHVFHHAPTVTGHATGLVDHGSAAVSGAPGASESVGAVHNVTELGDSATNLSAALTRQYESLIGKPADLHRHS
jgi:hypothetical protein